VVVLLFGIMHLLCGLLYVQDARVRKRLLRKLKRGRMGFRSAPAWVWNFPTDVLKARSHAHARKRKRTCPPVHPSCR
jgi:hypothetical protein